MPLPAMSRSRDASCLMRITQYDIQESNQASIGFKLMIKGIGIDIIRIRRIDKALERWGKQFEEKVFTDKEIESSCCLRKKAKLAYLAGRFAAKEAIFKAIGGGISWQDIEILAKENGQPYLANNKKTKEALNKKNIRKVLISISHDNDYAIAQAMAL